MVSTPPLSIERICFHEAGHAIVGMALGRILESIGPITDVGYGVASFVPEKASDPLVQVAISLAGLAAEHVFSSADFPTVAAIMASSRNDDGDMRDVHIAASYYFVRAYQLDVRDGIVHVPGLRKIVPTVRVYHEMMLEHAWDQVVAFVRGNGRDSIVELAQDLVVKRTARGQPIQEKFGGIDGQVMLRNRPEREPVLLALLRADLGFSDDAIKHLESELASIRARRSDKPLGASRGQE